MPFGGQGAHTHHSPLDSTEFRHGEAESSRVSTLGDKAARQRDHAYTPPGGGCSLSPNPLGRTSEDRHQHRSLRHGFLGPVTQAVPCSAFAD